MNHVRCHYAFRFNLLNTIRPIKLRFIRFIRFILWLDSVCDFHRRIVRHHHRKGSR